MKWKLAQKSPISNKISLVGLKKVQVQLGITKPTKAQLTQHNIMMEDVF